MHVNTGAPRNAAPPPGYGTGRPGRIKIFGMLGPAFVAAVAFVDPGNFGTNISAGTEFGYLLVWVVVCASAIGTFVQYLSAKLGLATGQSLAEVCREHTSTPVRIGLWLVAEAVVVMTDLAEFVGGALALNLLLGLPMVAGGLVMAAVTTFVIALRLRGRDVFPAVVMGLLFVIAIGFAVLLARLRFDPGQAVGGLVPAFEGERSVLLAAGIVGATVMPHAVFLHSSLAGGFTGGARTLRFLRRDVLVAMSLAGAVNLSMLLMATSLPAGTGDTLQSVHAALRASAGPVAAVVFGLVLLASGLASSCAGVFSGQTIMRGFLHRRSSVWVRRAVSIVPALVILAFVDPTEALVFSQVALSFGLPFALVPLVLFTSRRAVMGDLVNRRSAVVAGCVVTLVVLALNAVLLIRTVL